MKHLILFLIIIVGFILLQCLNLESFGNLDYKPPIAHIKMSKKINDRGVFALKDYSKGDIIEVCPCISDDSEKFDGVIQDYLFKYDKKTALVAFGYCSMYNHSDKHNALWKVMAKDKLQIYATKDIKEGEEIFISYGEGYWDSRESATKL